MSEVILKVSDLHTRFGRGERAVRAVDGVDFEIRRGETFALLGESGCGKSMTALSLMRLVPEPAGHITAGSVMLHDTDLLQLPEAAMRTVRGRRIAMIFQEPMTSLNPVLTVGQQIGESLTRHQGLRGVAMRNRVIELLDAVGIPDSKQRIDEYPHQLSGGMKQRVMIAIALAGEPDLLIADEPTTALDVTIQSQVLQLMQELQQKTEMAILLITHDLGVVAEMADRVAVMYAGQIIEQADRQSFFAKPRHPYSQKLFESLPTAQKRGTDLAVIRGTVPPLDQQFQGCRFVDRCDRAWDLCHTCVPVWQQTDQQGVRCHLYDKSVEKTGSIADETTSAEASRAPESQANGDKKPLLSIRELKVHFPIHKGLFKRVAGHVRAVDGVSLEIPQGHTVALVGESGCGKTTVGKALLQLIHPTAGEIEFDGRDLTALNEKTLRGMRNEFQIIFQDPFSSMNPRMMVGDIIEEGMVAQGTEIDGVKRSQRIDQLLTQVGLDPSVRYRYPHEFSGGQRQRICVARALAVQPRLIVCDEPTSALDVSVQAQILNLLGQLQTDLDLAYLFITHDISVVSYLAHEVAVMYLGRIVEYGTVESVLDDPCHPYTKALLSAVPEIDSENKRQVIRLQGDIPSPANPPAGCHFHPRCPEAFEPCRASYPPITRLSDGRRVNCHLYTDNQE